MSLSSSSALAPNAPAAKPAAGLARHVALIGAAVALLALSAQVRVPMWPVPATLQTFTVLMMGATYAPFLAGASVLVYLALGAAGVSVFTGAQGGLAYMVGPTGGYLVGFVFGALAIAALTRRGWGGNVIGMAAALSIGTVVIYLFGLSWLAWLFASEKGMAWVLQAGVLNFLPADLVKIALAAQLAPILRRAISR